MYDKIETIQLLINNLKFRIMFMIKQLIKSKY